MTDQAVTPAQILGVGENATPVEARITFLQYVKKFHPDQFETQKEKERNASKLMAFKYAYETLTIRGYCDLRDGEPQSERKRLRDVLRASKSNGGIESYMTMVRRLGDEVLYLQACDSLAEGDFLAAVKTFSAMIKDRKKNWLLHQKLAEAYLGLGTLIPARNALKKALTLDGNEAWCNLLLGRIEETDHNPRLARYHYEQAYWHDPNDPEIRKEYFRGSLLAEAFRKKLATWLRRLLSIGKTKPPQVRLIPDKPRSLGRIFLPDPNARSFHCSGIV